MSGTEAFAKKVMLLGDPSVGKTSLIRKYVYDKFDDKYISTLGTKISRKRLMINYPEKALQVDLTLMIWDMMGQQEYKLIHQTAYVGTQGAMIVCDTTRRATLENVPNWVSELYDVTGDIPLVFIGNKMDLTDNRQFELNDLKTMVEGFNAPVFYTSAKSGINVEDAFKQLGQRLIEKDL